MRRLVLFVIGELALGGDARFEELRLAVGGHLVAVGGHNAIAVRVHGVVVDPVAVVETVQIEFARGDHRVLADAVDVVFVDRDGVGERVVLLGLLQLFERRGDDLRVKQADLSGWIPRNRPMRLPRLRWWPCTVRPSPCPNRTRRGWRRCCAGYRWIPFPARSD